jgi:hypothetical protein
MTPEQKIARNKKLVNDAKAIISHQLGLTVGAMRISNKLRWLQSDDPRNSVFDEFIKAIPTNIPLGKARSLWHAEMILSSDKIIAVVEQKYRERIIQACLRLIEDNGVHKT